MYILSRSFFFPRSVLSSRAPPPLRPTRFLVSAFANRSRGEIRPNVDRHTLLADRRRHDELFAVPVFRKRIQQSGKKEKTSAVESIHRSTTISLALPRNSTELHTPDSIRKRFEKFINNKRFSLCSFPFFIFEHALSTTKATFFYPDPRDLCTFSSASLICKKVERRNSGEKAKEVERAELVDRGIVRGSSPTEIVRTTIVNVDRRDRGNDVALVYEPSRQKSRTIRIDTHSRAHDNNTVSLSLSLLSPCLSIPCSPNSVSFPIIEAIRYTGWPLK